eukprot:TRINITY_DN48035_c0_g1_i1.p1 TRINITY_DN48035_c0_g1~~TRINITY_DN48035_c0_g1_i1.p1  ORF type:complete len:440 (-),score=82.79 TRINITY_DN48035_c0_g1_i1:37-1326(-)
MKPGLLRPLGSGSGAFPSDGESTAFGDSPSKQLCSLLLSEFHRLVSGNPAEGHPEEYTLLRKEDIPSWILFFVVFFVLLFIDNCVMHSKNTVLTFRRAGLYTLFWILVAGAFNVYIYFTRGYEDAFEWGTGYLLEWMLSVDNLFVFRSIFLLFKTPDNQKHKPLFWGIVGAIFFRMGFFVVEELLLYHVSWMYFVLGVFLVYTGVKIVAVEEEDADDFDGPMMRMITHFVPLVDTYAPNALFFAQVRVDKETGDIVAPSWANRAPPASAEEAANWRATPRGTSKQSQHGGEECDSSILQWRMTRLCLVVVCLELSDIVFAIDSVSAIVAQIPDLFLAYTACVFAMLGLRATFFFVDELVKLFSLLSYAVAFILVFLGVKLMLKPWIHIAPGIVCGILVSTLALSLVGSLILEQFKGDEKEEALGEAERA